MTEPKCETDSHFCEQLWLSHIYMCKRVKDSGLLTGVNFCIIWIFDWIWKKNTHSELTRHTSEVRVLFGVSELVPNESSPVSHIKASYFLSAENIFTGLLWTSVSLGTNWFVLNARRRGCRGRVTVQDTPRTLQGHSRTTHYSLNQLCKIWHCIYCELYI